MKQYFGFTLEGRDWSRLYVWFWVPSLLLMVLSIANQAPSDGDLNASLRSLLLSLAIGFLTTLVQAYFTVPILKTWYPKLSIDGKAFGFGGDSLAFTALNAKGYLLTLVTLGIYFPWYTKQVLDYLAQETTFDGASARFQGRPGPLLARFVGLLFLALFLAIGAGVVVGLNSDGALENGAIEIATVLVMLLALPPLIYVIYKWMVQISWRSVKIEWKTDLSAIGVIYLQALLTVLSLGLWWPGATLVLYRYFLARTSFSTDGRQVVHLAFEGNLTEGWKLLWGQTLLTVVTLGFYGAWSGPRIARYLAEGTSVVVEANVENGDGMGQGPHADQVDAGSGQGSDGGLGHST